MWRSCKRIRAADTPGFKPFTMLVSDIIRWHINLSRHCLPSLKLEQLTTKILKQNSNRHERIDLWTKTVKHFGNSPRHIRKNPRSMYARVPHMMAQFVLKIEKLSHIIWTAPILEIARVYGLRPRLQPLLSTLVFRAIVNIQHRYIRVSLRVHLRALGSRHYTSYIIHNGSLGKSRENDDIRNFKTGCATNLKLQGARSRYFR